MRTAPDERCAGAVACACRICGAADGVDTAAVAVDGGFHPQSSHDRAGLKQSHQHSFAWRCVHECHANITTSQSLGPALKAARRGGAARKDAPVTTAWVCAGSVGRDRAVSASAARAEARWQDKLAPRLGVPGGSARRGGPRLLHVRVRACLSCPTIPGDRRGRDDASRVAWSHAKRAQRAKGIPPRARDAGGAVVNELHVRPLVKVGSCRQRRWWWNRSKRRLRRHCAACLPARSASAQAPSARWPTLIQPRRRTPKRSSRRRSLGSPRPQPCLRRSSPRLGRTEAGTAETAAE